jgi:hypothetical protein
MTTIGRFGLIRSSLQNSARHEAGHCNLPHLPAERHLIKAEPIPESIFEIPIYPIHRIVDAVNPHKIDVSAHPQFGWRIALFSDPASPKSMPQEVSVSYQAIKSKVYRLIDTLVVGEKTEAEIQESIRRWWELIHPADRPIAQKYLLAVLERSTLALNAIENGLSAASNQPATATFESNKALRLVKIVKQTTKTANVGTAV